MAVVIVFWPMWVYSTSGAALRNPVGIRHMVAEIINRPVWNNGPGAPPDIEEGARTACGSEIGYQFFDHELRNGRSRPTKRCEKCSRIKPRDMTPMIGVSGGAYVLDDRVARAPGERTGQGSLLS